MNTYKDYVWGSKGMPFEFLFQFTAKPLNAIINNKLVYWLNNRYFFITYYPENYYVLKLEIWLIAKQKYQQSF